MANKTLTSKPALTRFLVDHLTATPSATVMDATEEVAHRLDTAGHYVNRRNPEAACHARGYDIVMDWLASQGVTVDQVLAHHGTIQQLLT